MKHTYTWPACTVFALWLLAGTVALLAPEDILSKSQFLKGFSDLVSTIFSIGGGQNSKSTFPEITALYHSITWLSLPFFVVLIWRWLNHSMGTAKSGLLTKVPLTFGNRIGLFLVLPIWLLLAYAGASMNHGGDTRLVALGSSKLQLALFGFAFSIGVATATTFFLFSLKRLFGSDTKARSTK